MERIFCGTPRAEIADLDVFWYQRKKAGFYPTIRDDARSFAMVPPLPKQGLPPHLLPWTGVVDRWETLSRTGKDRRKLPASLRQEGIWSVTGPVLPEGAEPWVLSMGVDPGPRRTLEEGYTLLLLAIAPQGWRPEGRTITLQGRFGEILHQRCEGMAMRIPIAWWEKWAYGAMGEGALYVVLDPPFEG